MSVSLRCVMNVSMFGVNTSCHWHQHSVTDTRCVAGCWCQRYSSRHFFFVVIGSEHLVWTSVSLAIPTTISTELGYKTLWACASLHRILTSYQHQGIVATAVKVVSLLPHYSPCAIFRTNIITPPVNAHSYPSTPHNQLLNTSPPRPTGMFAKTLCAVARLLMRFVICALQSYGPCLAPTPQTPAGGQTAGSQLCCVCSAHVWPTSASHDRLGDDLQDSEWRTIAWMWT